ncbi:MAG TPA: hypothetical protein VF678_05575 [bacterium]
MAVPSGKHSVTASSPTEAIKGDHQSLLMIMTGLGDKPASGRLLRGLTPYLDEQGAEHVILLTERRRREPWSASEEVVLYQEVVHWARNADGGVYRGTAWKGHTLSREEILPAFELDPLGVVDWAARRAQAAVVSTAEPMPLSPCIVPKPWGREIWYTGIEARGRAGVRTQTGESELPYALGMFPVPTIGEDEKPPVLLKALDPLPQAVIGDLYLEVHNEKWEVYVVMDVDRTAWADGIGRLRAGLAPEIVRRYRAKMPSGWEAQIGKDLTAAIKSYEDVRRRIDMLNDQTLQSLGADPKQGTPSEHRAAVAAAIPSALQKEEVQRRAAVESFLGHMDMPVGAVACLRPGVLHSLQHGVKVIEFQTPTYERLIAMFAQKVLTQPHWDVDAAVARMEKDTFTQPPLDVLQRTETSLLERVVTFPEFTVTRLTLQPGAAHETATAGNGAYQLLVGVKGGGAVRSPDGRSWALKSDLAYLIPATLGRFSITATGSEPLVLLVTTPTHTPLATAKAKR